MLLIRKLPVLQEHINQVQVNRLASTHLRDTMSVRLRPPSSQSVSLGPTSPTMAGRTVTKHLRDTMSILLLLAIRQHVFQALTTRILDPPAPQRAFWRVLDTSSRFTGRRTKPPVTPELTNHRLEGMGASRHPKGIMFQTMRLCSSLSVLSAPTSHTMAGLRASTLRPVTM